MTQEEKQLLLKDLCARLPYGIYIYHEDYCEDNPEKLDTIYYDSQLGDCGFQCCVDDMDEGYHNIEKIKPYLRSLSSMTEEEKEEFFEKWGWDSWNTNTFDWLNAHHFDYRGLIPMGLALEVTEDNNPYK